MKHRILLVQEIHQAGIDLLRKEAEVIFATSTGTERLEEEIADCDAAIVRITPFPESVISAGRKLRVIGKHGVGYDNIDIEAAARRGIPVVYAPGSNDISVAEHTVGLMVNLAKSIAAANNALKLHGDYQFRFAVKTVELYDKTLGIVGLGQIGQKVAHICKNGFNMKVKAYDKFIPPEAAIACGVELVDSLDALLSAADFISLHVPATRENHHMIGEAQFKKMKRTAFLINTARGTVVDEKALVSALEQKVIAGAALDVFEYEPPARDNPLFSLGNLLVTPHMSAHSEEGLIRMATIVSRGVLDVLNGKKPPYLANGHLLGR
ncbi:MAG: hydroxyacid dehydrogenase [Firmicutes bacterium]|nr:hydroxyacid dehydrogenase [Bacillota bacterium]